MIVFVELITCKLSTCWRNLIYIDSLSWSMYTLWNSNHSQPCKLLYLSNFNKTSCLSSFIFVHWIKRKSEFIPSVTWLPARVSFKFLNISNLCWINSSLPFYLFSIVTLIVVSSEGFYSHSSMVSFCNKPATGSLLASFSGLSSK